MVETEVETILREIRERVITQQRSAQDVTTAAPIAANGNSRVAETPSAASGNRESTSKNLALINSYLTTTARAWDRLPPVVSNRSGFLATLELWWKRQMKRATRWYAWEQVNFNAAVHHALRDLLPVLAAYEDELEKLRAETSAAHNAQWIELEQYQNAQAGLRAELGALRAELAASRGELGQQRAETLATLQAQSDLTSAQTAGVEAQLNDLIDELRARDEILRAEQRVCFKQLSLQTGEAATLEDRARRKTETLLGELQRRVDEIEKTKK
jgi:murein L,D-transpeptidase YcbB/YkuD